MAKKTKNKKSRPVVAKEGKPVKGRKATLKTKKTIHSKPIPKKIVKGKTGRVVVKESETLIISAINADVMSNVGRALDDILFLDYVAKNVGSQGNDVLRELAKGPRNDEELAERVNVKLNEVRRVLNLLNKHGIVRYDVKKDSSGWLTFEWHVDYVAFSDFYNILGQKIAAPVNSLPDNCNDFFVCGDCKKTRGLVYSFDVAYDKSFKCACGKSLEMLSRNEAEHYIKN